MMRTESPVARAFRQLSDLARGDGYSDARLFALAWLAAGRMVSKGHVPAIRSIDQLADGANWHALWDAGFPPEAFDLVAAPRASAAAHDLGRRAAAAAIVFELSLELGEHPWDVLPYVVGGGARRGADWDGTVIPELASLLMDLVGEPDGSELWIPFDSGGQLTIEALRRGWHVLTASPMAAWSLVRLLLLTIESGHPQHPKVRNEIERDAHGRPIGRAAYALVMPPFGLPVKESRMALWDAAGGRGYEQFARSESWAIFEFVNRVDRRAVFVTPQGVLFAKGQEQRLREYLLHRGGERNEVEAVISLPPGGFGSSTIAGAVLVINPGGECDAVYMAELGSGRRSILEAGEVVERGRGVALARVDGDRSRLVNRDEIAENEYSFAPSRYLRRVADLGAEAVKLGDICEALRPPTTSKEQGPFEAAEVGMQDLNGWRPLNHFIEKTVFLRSLPKDSALVQPGDIVFSIKGTVGKAALMGVAAHERPTVVSQSCLSLRADPKKVRPEYLLMYLRSPHGQAQLEGLQVGAGVQHISPGTLLSSLLVPVPPLDDQGAVLEDFENLCRLEDQVARLEGEITDIARRRWPDEPR